MTDINVLDCTLRDGGYYNDWDFLPDLVENYLTAISKTGVHTVEIGFRFPPQDKFLGAFAYCTDDYLRKLPIPKSLEIAVMVNAKDLVSGPGTSADVVDRMFQTAKKSPVSLVRIAAHVREIDDCREGVLRLKELGYKVGFNIMQVATHEPAVLEEATRKISAWDSVDVLYFADSLGNMDSNQVTDIMGCFRKHWQGPIGMHAHDNMGNALSNSMAALDNGATWIDGTVCGMGRGAGNVRTEFLLVEMRRRGYGDFHADAIFPLALNDIENLRQTYQWGSNLFYFLSGAYGIHPTYVQEMLKTGDQNTSDAISALDHLHQDDARSYSHDRLRQALKLGTIDYEGTWDATGWADGRDILILGSGPWIKNHFQAVEDFIDRVKPRVICLNTSTPLSHDKIDAFAACQAIRVATESAHYGSLGAPLIAPAAEIGTETQATIGEGGLLDYGVCVTPNTFDFAATACKIPHQLVAAYALAFSNAAGAKRILLAGFDGYEPGNPLQEKMEEVFHIYQQLANSVPIVAVTPTTNSIPQMSLFAPID
ncbi:MAG: aldolase catalytic domain-containing protein [Proteobacteria bacterium]|nr:aldolase catalytic domain-containing protein [Pseudomonadota bacterium]